MMAAASFLGNIILFGGHEALDQEMYIFSEQGEMRKNLS